MANGELCKKCGNDETAHQQQRGFKCSGFISAAKHHRNCFLSYRDEICPGINCQGFNAYVYASERRAGRRLSRSHYLGPKNPPRKPAKPQKRAKPGKPPIDHSVLMFFLGGKVFDIGC